MDFETFPRDLMRMRFDPLDRDRDGRLSASEAGNQAGANLTAGKSQAIKSPAGGGTGGAGNGTWGESYVPATTLGERVVCDGRCIRRE